MSYNEPRPIGFSLRSYFDSGEAVWRDAEAEAIPFGEEQAKVDLTGIAEEVAERARRDAARGRHPTLAIVEDPPPPDGPVFTDLRDLVARDTEWLDKPFMPKGELVTNNAKGSTGKGLLSVHYAAKISRGELGESRFVLLAVAEDAFETTVKPRLLAAGADLAYVRGVNWQRKGLKDAILIPDDIPALEEHVAALDAQLLVIDPLLSHLSRKTNSYVDHEVKVALQPLTELAHNTGCTVLGNGNFSKDTTRGAVNAAQGSNAFTNTPRVALAMAHDDEDPEVRVVEVIKSNIGPIGIGRNYRIKTAEVAGLREAVPILEDEGASSKSIDDLLSKQQSGKRVPAQLVQEVILRELAAGEQARHDLDKAVKKETGANSDSTYKSGLDPLRKARRIKPRKAGVEGGWFWSLDGADSDEDIPW